MFVPSAASSRRERSRFGTFRRGYSHTALGLALMLAAVPAAGFTAEQVQRGSEIFRQHCQRCHGPYAEGRDGAYKGLRAPELIGPNALPLQPHPYQRIRHRQFRTAADVFDFASAAMPADQPASLYAPEYWDVLSFVLAANGTQPDSQPLNEAGAADLVLHPNEAPTADPGTGAAQR